MIKNFKSKITEKVFNREPVKSLSIDIQKIAQRKLKMINAAIDINDLKIPPGNRLERLQGNRKDQYSVRINKQWRICFKWRSNDAYDVEIIDYHN